MKKEHRERPREERGRRPSGGSEEKRRKKRPATSAKGWKKRSGRGRERRRAFVRGREGTRRDERRAEDEKGRGQMAVSDNEKLER